MPGLGSTLLLIALVASVPFLAFVALVMLVLRRDHETRLRTDAAIWEEFSDRDPRTDAMADELARVAHERGAEMQRRGESELVAARLTHPKRLRRVA